MRLEFSGPSLEGLNGKRQSFCGEGSRKLQTHRMSVSRSPCSQEMLDARTFAEWGVDYMKGGPAAARDSLCHCAAVLHSPWRYTVPLSTVTPCNTADCLGGEARAPACALAPAWLAGILSSQARRSRRLRRPGLLRRRLQGHGRGAAGVVGRGHESLLTNLDTWHPKRVMGIADL
jgi:hypothetical protein